MGRPKKIITTTDEYGNVLSEEKVMDSAPVVATEAPSKEMIDKSQQEEFERLKQEVERLKKIEAELRSTERAKSVEELMKENPYFGTRMYLKYAKQNGTDRHGMPIWVVYNISAFPDALDTFTNERLAPDLGFDGLGSQNEKPYPGRAAADKLRESNEEKVVYDGVEMGVKDAIHKMRLDYLQRRIKADEVFLRQKKLLNTRPN